MKAYLDRFSSGNAATSVPNEPHAEPPWAKAIRLLEAVPVGRDASKTDIPSQSEVNNQDINKWLTGKCWLEAWRFVSFNSAGISLIYTNANISK